MKKRFIKIPKNFFKGINYEIKVPFWGTPLCPCHACCARRDVEKQLLSTLSKLR